MAKILIPDYLGQQVLSGARSLYANHDQCTLAWKKPSFLERLFCSKAINGYLAITPSHIDSQMYINDLLSILTKQPFDVLLPFGLSSYYALAKHAKQLSSYVSFMVSHFDAFELANDKLATAKHAASIGVPVPAIHSDYNETDIYSISKDVRYPVVIKARAGSGVRDRIYFAYNEKELIEYYQKLYDRHDSKAGFSWKPPLVQEYIPGYIHDACALAVNGQTNVILTQKRVVMYPVSGGVGAVNVTTHDEKLTALCKTLLESLNWHGPAQVEFKFDERDKQYKLIEINPKFWGTLDLSIRAGVNFPLMIRNYLVEGKQPQQVNYHANQQYTFYFPQYMQAFLQLKSRRNQVLAAADDISPETCWHDFHWDDCRPDLLRAARAVFATMKLDWRQAVK